MVVQCASARGVGYTFIYPLFRLEGDPGVG
jgi:hypothetical protein